MKTIFLLLFSALSWASPIYVTTSISDADWMRAELAAASPSTYTSQFLGYPGYTEIEDFSITRDLHDDGTVCWIVWEEIDGPTDPSTSTSGLQPIPEPGMFPVLALCAVLAVLVLAILNRKEKK